MSPSGASESPPARPRVRLTARGIIYHRGRVLLLEGHDPDRIWYFLPGGGVDHGETLLRAVVREVKEETGLTVVPQRLVALREFIASLHSRRSKFMPATNHALAATFLCTICQETHGDADHDDLLPFPGDADGTGAVKGMRWIDLKDVAELDIMPPHLRSILKPGFPENLGQGVVFWPEDDPTSVDSH